MGPFSLNDRWGIKDNRATTFLHSSLFSAFRSVSPNFKLPVPICCHPISFSVSLSFSFLLSCPVGSSLQVPLILLWRTCAPSRFTFSHSGDEIFIRPNSMSDTIPHFFIRNMISVGDAQKSLKASHFCSLCLSL